MGAADEESESPSRRSRSGRRITGSVVRPWVSQGIVRKERMAANGGSYRIQPVHPHYHQTSICTIPCYNLNVISQQFLTEVVPGRASNEKCNVDHNLE